MSIVKTTLSLTDQDREWMASLINNGEFVSHSEYVRSLIRQDKAQRLETPEQIEAIRAKLIAAEKSVEQHGWVKKTPKEMLNGFKEKARRDGKI